MQENGIRSAIVDVEPGPSKWRYWQAIKSLSRLEGEDLIHRLG